MTKSKSPKQFITVLISIALSLSCIPGGLLIPDRVFAAEYDLTDGDISITQNGDYIITSNATKTENVITVAAGVEASITLKNTIIQSTTTSPIKLASRSKVTMTLEGTNSLSSSGNYAGINLPGGARLTIDGDGALTISSSAPSIGGNNGANGTKGADGARGVSATSNNRIPGGTGGSGVMGTAGGAGESAGELIINGGTISVNGTLAGGGSGGIGGAGGAGGQGGSGYYTVGGHGGNGAQGNVGGNGGDAGNITINGGTVSANKIAVGGAGGNGGAGNIGGKGGQGYLSNYQRSGNGGQGGNGGLGGNGGAAGNVTITNGTLSAREIGTSGSGGNGGKGANGGEGYRLYGLSSRGGNGGTGGTGGVSGATNNTVTVAGGNLNGNIAAVACNGDVGTGGAGGTGGRGQTSDGSDGHAGGNGSSGSKNGTLIFPPTASASSTLPLSTIANVFYLNAATASLPGRQMVIRTHDYRPGTDIYVDISNLSSKLINQLGDSWLVDTTPYGQLGSPNCVLNMYFYDSVSNDDSYITFYTDADLPYARESRVVSMLNASASEVILGDGEVTSTLSLGLSKNKETLPSLLEGYSPEEAAANQQIITIKNTGTQAVNNLTVGLDGDGADAFVRSNLTQTTLTPGESIEVTISIADDLEPGTYAAQIKASAKSAVTGMAVEERLAVASQTISSNGGTDPKPDPQETIVNDDDDRITYSGAWTYYQDSVFHDGDEHFSNTVGSYAELIFEGTGVTWLGATSNNLGIAEVYVDGVLVDTVDQYSPNLIPQLELFSISGLSSGMHTIRIVVTGNKNASASDVYATIDAFRYVSEDVEPPEPPEPPPVDVNVVNDDSPLIRYAGAWTYYDNDARFYEGDEHFSNRAGNYAEFTFTGTSVTWIGATWNNMGIAEVYIDGELEDTIDLYSPELDAQLELFTIRNLPYGEHAIKIVVTGSKNSQATDCHVTVDAFWYYGEDGGRVEPPEEPVTVNDDDPAITYRGNWTHYHDPMFYDGDEHFSNIQGDYAEFTFTGSRITWIGATANNLGFADVYIDGILEDSINQYTESLDVQLEMFTADLELGTHTIRIVVTGEQDDGAQDCYVTLDAFVYE